MSFWGDLGAAAGNIYLQRQGVPITLSGSGQAVSYKSPVQGSQVAALPPATSNPAMSIGSGMSIIPGTTFGQTAATPIGSSPVAKDVKNIGRWGLAFAGFLGVLLFLKPAEAGWLSLTVVMGALIFNAENAAAHHRPTVVQTVLGG